MAEPGVTGVGRLRASWPWLIPGQPTWQVRGRAPPGLLPQGVPGNRVGVGGMTSQRGHRAPRCPWGREPETLTMNFDQKAVKFLANFHINGGEHWTHGPLKQKPLVTSQ